MSNKNKLANFGPVYLINLKDHTHRLEHAKNEFAKYDITDYTVIEAVDGRNSDLMDIIHGRYPALKPSEIGCMTSHIKALKHWLETSDSEYAIIMEDDFSFDTVEYWNWDWDFVIKNLPTDLQILQLVMIKNDPIKFNLHKKEKFHRSIVMSYAWSTACYLIKRDYAKTLVKLHCVKDKYKLENYGYRNQAADVILYNLGNAYSMPLFTNMLDLKNSINHENGEFHIRSKNTIDSWWKEKASNYNKEQFFDTAGGLATKKQGKGGSFAIFHIDQDTPEMKKRNALVKSATDQLKKDFTQLETPTIFLKTQEDVKKFYKGSGYTVDPLGHFNNGWKPGELGVWASNLTAWENFAKSDFEYVILMEDDIVLEENFNEKLTAYMDELPANWDVFTAYIPDYGNERYKRKESLMIGKDNICKVYQSWSCLCYVVSKRGVQKLLKDAKRLIKHPIDHYLFFARYLNVYTIKMENKNICSIYETKSTIQEGKRLNMKGYV